MEWETVVRAHENDVLQRVRVPGGWLYRNVIVGLEGSLCDPT